MPKIHPAPEGLPPDDDDQGARAAFEDTAERVSDTGSGDINGGSAVTSNGSGLEHESAGDRNTTAAAVTGSSLTVSNYVNDTNVNSTAEVNNTVDNDVKTSDSPGEQTSDRKTETSDARAKSVRDTLRTLAEPAVYLPPGTPLTSSQTSPSRRPTLERMNTQLQRAVAALGKPEKEALFAQAPLGPIVDSRGTRLRAGNLLLDCRLGVGGGISRMWFALLACAKPHVGVTQEMINCFGTFMYFRSIRFSNNFQC